MIRWDAHRRGWGFFTEAHPKQLTYGNRVERATHFLSHRWVVWAVGIGP